ncbi:MAG TPA: MFS transporter [Burkholderiaceae bacterium]|nr:MFS transporter [Burkholderiaceae bacterium]
MSKTTERSALSPGAALLLLALANFAVGMGAFVVIGILTPLAADLGISKSQAGSLMTVYAVVYAITSPLLVAVTGRIDRTRALVGGMAAFGAGALAAAASSSLHELLTARCLMALGAGVVTPVAASVGVAMAGAEARGRALAIVFGGLTLAQALGVPLGAWLGYAYGWRTAFDVVVALGVLSAVACALKLPRGIQVPVASLASLAGALTSLGQGVAVSFTALFIGALYVFYTFLAPFLESRYGLGRDGVTVMLAIFGAGAVVGNTIGGVLTDRIGPLRTLVLLCTAQLVLLPMMTTVPMPLALFAALVAIWSICSWSFMVPQQARLALLAPERIPVLFALNAAAIYVGGSMGSALGGVTLRADGFTLLGPAGAVLALMALGSLFVRRAAS